MPDLSASLAAVVQELEDDGWWVSVDPSGEVHAFRLVDDDDWPQCEESAERRSRGGHRRNRRRKR